MTSDGSLTTGDPASPRFYTDPAGTRWRVYDVIVAGGRVKRLQVTPASSATHRVFVRSGGVQVWYKRGTTDIEYTPRAMRRMLAEGVSRARELTNG